jgi:hypothetical protein
VPQKSWGTIGALQFGTVVENSAAMAWLIHHDDIRVGSIVKR